MEKIEILFKIIEMTIAVIGLVLVVFGWIVPYKNSIKMEKLRIQHENEIESLRWKKDLLDKQISQLYGPIFSILAEADISFERILFQLGRRHIFPKDKGFNDLPEHEQQIWKHYVDTYKIKSQMKIVEIMRDNIHLIYKSEIPTCYKVFLDYALGWGLLDSQKRNNVPNFYEYHYSYNYPIEFSNYIRTTLKILQAEQYNLEKQLETISLN